MIDNQSKYYVIKFFDVPSNHIDKYVCVPRSWICGSVDMLVIVAYPIEDPETTRHRVKNEETLGRNWDKFLAALEFYTDDYYIAHVWIFCRYSKEPFTGSPIAAENNVVERRSVDEPPSRKNSTADVRKTSSLAQSCPATELTHRPYIYVVSNDFLFGPVEKSTEVNFFVQRTCPKSSSELSQCLHNSSRLPGENLHQEPRRQELDGRSSPDDADVTKLPPSLPKSTNLNYFSQLGEQPHQNMQPDYSIPSQQTKHLNEKDIRSTEYFEKGFQQSISGQNALSSHATHASQSFHQPLEKQHHPAVNVPRVRPKLMVRIPLNLLGTYETLINKKRKSKKPKREKKRNHFNNFGEKSQQNIQPIHNIPRQQDKLVNKENMRRLRDKIITRTTGDDKLKLNPRQNNTKNTPSTIKHVSNSNQSCQLSNHNSEVEQRNTNVTSVTAQEHFNFSQASHTIHQFFEESDGKICHIRSTEGNSYHYRGASIDYTVKNISNPENSSVFLTVNAESNIDNRETSAIRYMQNTANQSFERISPFDSSIQQIDNIFSNIWDKLLALPDDNNIKEFIIKQLEKLDDYCQLRLNEQNASTSKGVRESLDKQRKENDYCFDDVMEVIKKDYDLDKLPS